MEYKDIIYIFDLDNTLIWTPHWYEDVSTDPNGIVIHPGGCPGVKKALDLLSQHNFRLKLKTSKQLDANDVYFQVIDYSGKELSMNDLARVYSSSELNNANIEGGSRYTDLAAVVDDFDFYRDLDNLGIHGFNQEMLDKYNQSENVVILTARVNIPGMNDRILEVISQETKPPLEIFTQPLESKNSGRWKGEVISNIANKPGVTHIYFYDDNLEYIKSIQKVIDKNNLIHKVTIIHVSTKNKPTFAFQNIVKLVKIANRLDIKRLYREADLVDQLVESVVSD